MSDLIPRSAEWHEDRRGGLGATDAPVLTGDAPWSDVLTLFAVKSGIIDDPDIENPQTKWGRKLESTVAEWFSETTGKEVQPVTERPRHPEHDWMRTSLDYRVMGENAILECKTRRFANDEWGPMGSSEIPAHYLVQVQHELAVTGAEMCYLAVLFSGSDPRLYEIPRDEALIEALIALESDFMECVRTGTPPEAIIRRQRPVIPFRDGEITADATLSLGIEGVYNARQEIKALQAEEKKAAEAVKVLLGPNTAARAGAYRAVYKPNADSVEVRWELIAAAYRKTIEGLQRDIGGEIPAHWDIDLDAIESLFTEPRQGFRPLRITVAKEAVEAA